MRSGVYAVLIFIIALLFIGCGTDKREKMIAINNKIVKTNDSLYLKGQEWGMEIRAAWNNKDFAGVKAYNLAMTSFVDTKIAEIEKLEEIKEIEKLKRSELDFLTFEKQLVRTISVFNDFDSSTPEHDFVSAYDNLIVLSKEEAKRMQEIQRVQREFAAENDIPLQQTPY